MSHSDHDQLDFHDVFQNKVVGSIKAFFAESTFWYSNCAYTGEVDQNGLAHRFGFFVNGIWMYKGIFYHGSPLYFVASTGPNRSAVTIKNGQYHGIVAAFNQLKDAICLDEYVNGKSINKTIKDRSAWRAFVDEYDAKMAAFSLVKVGELLYDFPESSEDTKVVRPVLEKDVRDASPVRNVDQIRDTAGFLS